MNQRSTNRSFDAAMRLFKTRQRLEGGGVGENEGDRPTLGGVGGLALCAGLRASHLDGLRAPIDQGRNRRMSFLDSILVGVRHAQRSEGFAILKSRKGRREVGEVQQGQKGVGIHGFLRTGPIPAMSNPRPVTSDVSSPFSERIMNGPIPYTPIPYTVTPAGRAIAAAYKKRQEGQ